MGSHFLNKEGKVAPCPGSPVYLVTCHAPHPISGSSREEQPSAMLNFHALSGRNRLYVSLGDYRCSHADYVHYQIKIK